MRWLAFLFLSVFTTALMAQEPLDWEKDLSDYLSTTNALTLSSKKAKVVSAILWLDDEDYEKAVQQLGVEWKKKPERVEPLIHTLQTQWELQFFRPIQIKGIKDKNELLLRADAFAALTLVSSL